MTSTGVSNMTPMDDNENIFPLRKLLVKKMSVGAPEFRPFSKY